MVDELYVKNYNRIKLSLCTLSVTSFLLMGVGPCDKSNALLQNANDMAAISTPSPTSTPAFPTEKYLYVASGACYAGGVPTSAGIGVISKYSLTTGQRIGTVFSYIDQSPSDLPVGLIDYNNTQLITMVENAGGRRIDLISKFGTGLNIFYANSAVLSGAMRSIVKTSDLGLMLSKTSAIEKISSSKVRVTIGATTPYINAPAGACLSASTLVPFAVELPAGKVVYGNAGVTPNNKLAMISATGYSAVGDCLTTRVAPNTAALPTAAVVHPNGKLLVSYASTTYAANFVYSHDIDETTPSISAGTAIINTPAVVYAPSAMVADPDTGALYVANAAANAESIEKYNYTSSSGAFSRVGSTPFILKNEYIKCVSGLSIGY